MNIEDQVRDQVQDQVRLKANSKIEDQVLDQVRIQINRKKSNTGHIYNQVTQVTFNIISEMELDEH
jgi:hypothetical protein